MPCIPVVLLHTCMMDSPCTPPPESNKALQCQRSSVQVPGTANHFQVPLGLFDLEEEEYRGVACTAMVYKHVPVTDHFQVVDADTVLGNSTLQGMPESNFFLFVERQAKLR